MIALPRRRQQALPIERDSVGDAFLLSDPRSDLRLVFEHGGAELLVDAGDNVLRAGSEQREQFGARRQQLCLEAAAHHGWRGPRE